MRELKSAASRVVAEAECGRRFVVTRRDEPVALLLSQADAEDFVLAHAEEFVELRREARRR